MRKGGPFGLKGGHQALTTHTFAWHGLSAVEPASIHRVVGKSRVLDGGRKGHGKYHIQGLTNTTRLSLCQGIKLHKELKRALQEERQLLQSMAEDRVGRVWEVVHALPLARQ